MAPNKEQKSCVECLNGLVTCNGCEKRFCLHHWNQHLQHLQTRMDEVIQEHDQLSEILNSPFPTQYFQTRINEWDVKSIERIKDAAKQARIDLQTSSDRRKHRQVDSFDEITQQLKASQRSNAYGEKELNEWSRQLKKLRQMLEKPVNIEIIEDDATHRSIFMLKVIEKHKAEIAPIITSIESQSRPQSVALSQDGTYRVTGYTKNSSDGNKTTIHNMVLHMKDGRLSASGSYNSGSNYNSALGTNWSGSYSGAEIQWTENYGDHGSVFHYRGHIEQNTIRGTYNWTYNNAVGSFEFELHRLNE